MALVQFVCGRCLASLLQNRKISPVLVSTSLAPLQLAYAATDPAPLEVYLPPPTESAVLVALADMCPEGENQGFYENFLQQVCC